MSFRHILAAPLFAAMGHAQGGIMRRDDASSSSTAASSSPSATSSQSGSASSASATASSSDAGITNAPSASRTLPSLTGGAGTYSYPPPSVPPTANAPFMQKSSLPNGTFFICVGAVLGFFFLMIIVWRGWAAWMLHRRMNAANVQYVGVPSRTKSGGSPKDRKLRKSALYQRDAGSEMSLDALMKKENGTSRKNGKTAKDNRQSNLFFSPTAGAGAHGTAQQRASSFLPSGYYAAGGSAVGSTVVNPNSTSDVSMRGDNRLSMADFGAVPRQSSPYKDSPLLRPQDGHGLEPPNLPYARNSGARASMSSLSGSETHSRAPSAYLDDLFDSTPVNERRSNERNNWI